MNLSKIETLLVSYSEAWVANDQERIASHWDKEDPEPFYKAEENAEFFHNLDEIKKYWVHNEGFHDEVCQKYSNISFKSLPGNYAIVFLRMHWYISFAENTRTLDGAAFAYAGKSMGGENQVLLLIRETDAGLKIAGWSEIPNSPISYMGQLYEWAADPIRKLI